MINQPLSGDALAQFVVNATVAAESLVLKQAECDSLQRSLAELREAQQRTDEAQTSIKLAVASVVADLVTHGIIPGAAADKIGCELQDHEKVLKHWRDHVLAAAPVAKTASVDASLGQPARGNGPPTRNNVIGLSSEARAAAYRQLNDN